MSLINEALKKAQRQRSLDSAPLSSAPSGIAAAAVTTHVRAASHRHRQNPLWFALGLLALGATAAVLIMRFGLAPTAPASSPAAVPVAATQPTAIPPLAQPAPAPVAVAPIVEATPAPMVSLPPIPQASRPAPVAVAAPTPVAQTITTPPAPPATTRPRATPAAVASPLPAANPAPVAVTPVAVVPIPATPTPAQRETAIATFLASARLTAVRGVDQQARVLMNEKAYRLNDIVSSELGLRLSAVRPGRLVFTDAQGRTYEKGY